jgi:hypothetical protein
MTVQTRDSLFNDGASLLQRRTQRSYYAEVPTGSLDEQSRLIEQVIRFAFETLGARHLDVRVVAARDTPRAIAHDEGVSTMSA